jgi:Resolvase, N terminal domain
MAVFGYARVSTRDQNLAGQIAELQAAGCGNIYKEKASSARTDRPELAKLIRRLDADDVLVVTRLDRLVARERRLAHFERLVPQVLAVQLQQVEGVQEDLLSPVASRAAARTRGGRCVAGDRLAVDQAGPHLERVHRLHDQRIARCPIVAVASEQTDAKPDRFGSSPIAVRQR